MERRHLGSGTAPRHMGVFLATCAMHAAAIYWLGSQVITRQSPLWTALEVTFVPTERKQPPPPTEIPVLPDDAFAERPLIDIPAPDVEIDLPAETTNAIQAPPPPDPPPQPATLASEGKGFGPLTKPRVISSPKHPQDRYPRASIRARESGRTVVQICISATGAVESVDIAQSSGFRRLDEAALDMALDYGFAPAMREGHPVAVCLPYGIDFRLGVGGRRDH